MKNFLNNHKEPLLVLIGTSALFIGMWFMDDYYDEKRAIKVAQVSDEWHKRYPDAVGNSYRFCDKTGFLVQVRNYGHTIGSEELITADNDVPIRCETNYHTVIENTGKTSTNTVF